MWVLEGLLFWIIHTFMHKNNREKRSVKSSNYKEAILVWNNDVSMLPSSPKLPHSKQNVESSVQQSGPNQPQSAEGEEWQVVKRMNGSGW